VIALLALLGALLAPALARTRQISPAIRCANNLRQFAVANRQWTDDNDGYLLTCETMPGVPRPVWVSGNLDFNAANASNWDVNQDIARSPLWAYIQGKAGLFRCPADKSSLIVNGVRMPRVRSYSMSQVFSRGEWLDRSFNNGQTVWHTYSKFNEIVLPAKTFVFIDEHPDSINDGAFANACTGAQPGDPPTAAQVIDFPASLHDSLANLSFADGHVEAYRWKGSYIRNAPVTYQGAIALNVWARDSGSTFNGWRRTPPSGAKNL